MELQEKINFWRESSEKDMGMTNKLFAGGDYNYSLFFLHLSIEKILKGLILKITEKSPLPIHNLVQLTKSCGIEVDKELDKKLTEISSFNISARYDDYKQEFYKKATREFAILWLEIGKSLYVSFSKKYE